MSETYEFFPFGGTLRSSERKKGLKPGASIEVGNNLCGVAMIYNTSDGPYLLTCGHAFPPLSRDVYPSFTRYEKRRDIQYRTLLRIRRSLNVYKTKGRHTPVAQLTYNFLDDVEPIDAALCRLTSAGRTMLKRTSPNDDFLPYCMNYEDWTRAEELREAGEFEVWVFPTRPGEHPIQGTKLFGIIDGETTINTDDWNKHLAPMLWTKRMTERGDSGSILIVKQTEDLNERRYFGLCSGGREHSYFTPFSAVHSRVVAFFENYYKTSDAEVKQWSYTQGS